ncbi:hypothetical protein GDO86_004152 [Hymenochirus boettgeri]|uniref:COMM domain-containing protein 6 n=1 Tax=Hymenochirus boettgeri TaxID=247094 RepID=A0A8T2K7S1_9PIPI|nr:hypothetical protein GDO86_004152 [Hymenochirus boettgeri]
MFNRELAAFGFEKTGNLINRCNPDLFAELCQHIVQHLLSQKIGIDNQILLKRFQASGVQTNEDELKKIVHGVTFLFRWFMQVIRHVWNEEGRHLTEAERTKGLVPVGQLVDFQWKIGMAVSSDTCRSLNHPYVSVELRIADYSGQIASKMFELTIPEFQNFFRQFKEMSASLETV